MTRLDRPPPRRRCRPSSCSASAGVRDLHVGLDRASEGRAVTHGGVGEPGVRPSVSATAVGAGVSGRCSSPRSASTPRCSTWLVGAGHRRHAGGRRGPGERSAGAAGDLVEPPGCRQATRAAVAAGRCWDSGGCGAGCARSWSAARRCRHALAAGWGGVAAGGQPLRPDRGHRRCVHCCDRWTRPSATGRRRSARRSPTPGCTCSTAAAPRAGRRGRRAVRRRCAAGARLPGPARADRGAVRGRPVRVRRRADVPHRRPGALAADGDAGVPRPRRRPGEDPRLPDRARRDRGRARRAIRRSPRPRSSPARTPPGTSAWSPTSSRLTATWLRRLTAAVRDSSPTGCPSTWCPSAFVVLDALPLTATASWTAGRCPPRTTRPRRRRPARRPPRSRRLLCRCSPRCSGVDRVGVDDDFFASAATRCWRPGSSAGSARRSASSCRCGRCSRPPRSRPGRAGWRRPARPRTALAPRTRPEQRAAVLRPAAAVVPRPAGRRPAPPTTSRSRCG